MPNVLPTSTLLLSMRLVKLLSVTLSVLSPTPDLAQATTYSNPLERTNGGDPSIVWHGGWWYMMATTWNDLRLRRTRTLNGPKNSESKLIYSSTDAARCCLIARPTSSTHAGGPTRAPTVEVYTQLEVH
ncbi:unnamed protein product [Clonostachys byssicola]|uniref:Secreted protein n=1 Tax=Clonostachys byssicola TaxID=160290 RepID=A0A9N9UBV1_9HYPO|nr:unnamed protein product [Clonostachys byssicola]